MQLIVATVRAVGMGFDFLFLQNAIHHVALLIPTMFSFAATIYLIHASASMKNAK